MITLITGNTGAAKSLFAIHKIIYKNYKNILKKPEKNGHMKIWSNSPLRFGNEDGIVSHYEFLAELYKVKNGYIFMDEAQKILEASRWRELPNSFKDKIVQHRHHHLDIITTTQSIMQIDPYIRRNIHEWYHINQLFRIPFDDRVKPYIQISRVTKRIKDDSDMGETNIKWKIVSVKFLFISVLWTRKLYDTYTELALKKFVCRMFKKPGKRWTLEIKNRNL